MDARIERFKIKFLERLSNAYNDEILKTIENALKGVVEFNNILVLKKAQKYIRHTNSLFNKAILKMFCGLLIEKGNECKTPQDWFGKTVLIKNIKDQIHFIPHEKTVGFPKVPWISKEKPGSGENLIKHIYVILIEDDENGKKYIGDMNKYASQTRRYMSLESFVSSYFDNKIWLDLKDALAEINKKSKSYR